MFSLVPFGGRLRGHKVPDHYQVPIDMYLQPGPCTRHWALKVGQVLLEPLLAGVFKRVICPDPCWFVCVFVSFAGLSLVQGPLSRRVET